MSKLNDMMGFDPIAELDRIMPRVTEMPVYRAKKFLGHDPDSFRIASEIMAREDEIDEIESVIGGFVDGQSDCKEGMPHKSGKGDAYDRGYAAQYELDQINNERTRNK